MQCDNHPDKDAIGACVSCGKGVCSLCKISFDGLIHCRQCVEAGRVKRRPRPGESMQQRGPSGTPPQGVMYPNMPGYGPGGRVWGYKEPEPRGRPSRAMFQAGIAGAVLNAVLAFIVGVLWIAAIFSNFSMAGDAALMFMMVVPPAAMLLVIPGLYGLYHNYGFKYGQFIVMAYAGLLSGYLIVWLVAFIEYTTVGRLEEGFPTIFIGALLFGAALLMATLSIWSSNERVRPTHPARGALRVAMFLMLAASISFMALLGIYTIGWLILGAALVAFAYALWLAPLPSRTNA